MAYHKAQMAQLDQNLDTESLARNNPKESAMEYKCYGWRQILNSNTLDSKKI